MHDQKKLFARQAEVFAGFVEMTDYEIGRIVEAVEEIGELDNTLFIFIAGDNATSAEGGMVGMYNEMTYFNGVEEKVEDLLPLMDDWGLLTTVAPIGETASLNQIKIISHKDKNDWELCPKYNIGIK